MAKILESEVCERFKIAAEEQGWVVHPEVSGWDLVLVWDGELITSNDGRVGRAIEPPVWELRPGDQIAVEAKARSSVDALAQVLGRTRIPRGPDFVAVLAPSWSKSYEVVCRELGILTLDSRHYEGEMRWVPGRVKKALVRKPVRGSFWARRDHGAKMWVPPIVTESVEAGVPSPSPLTPWRVSALRICGLLRSRGYVTSADFKSEKLSITRWRQGGPRFEWLKDSGEKIGRLKKYVLPDPLPQDFPDVGWEVERDKLMAAAAEDSA